VNREKILLSVIGILVVIILFLIFTPGNLFQNQEDYIILSAVDENGRYIQECIRSEFKITPG